MKIFLLIVRAMLMHFPLMLLQKFYIRLFEILQSFASISTQSCLVYLRILKRDIGMTLTRLYIIKLLNRRYYVTSRYYQLYIYLMYCFSRFQTMHAVYQMRAYRLRHAYEPNFSHVISLIVIIFITMQAK